MMKKMMMENFEVTVMQIEDIGGDEVKVEGSEIFDSRE